MDDDNNNNTMNQLMNIAQDDSASADFEIARANIHAMVDTAKDSIATLAEIASQSQHPRAFEVLAKLIDTTVNANKALVDLQAKIREIQAVDMPINGAQTINNNLFVGSTTELQKMIAEMKNGPKKE